MPFIATVPTEFLSVAEQTSLIATAQDVPVITEVDTDGEEVTRYGKTPASEAAMSRLVLAFMPVMEKEARRSKVLDFDDALATIFAEFVSTVHRHDVSSIVPFSATIGTILRRIVSDTDRTSDVIVVRESVAAAYWRLMHRHDHDFAAAYAEVKATANGLAPATFLAVHNIIGGVDSLDPVLRAEDSEGAARHALASSIGSHEDAVIAALDAERLLGSVSARQESICRLAYGFADLPTEKIRLAKGYAIAETLDDGQAAHALDLSRPTVQRDRVKALAAMREIAEADFLATV